jgi:CDGSH-type Zn-finger protein
MISIIIVLSILLLTIVIVANREDSKKKIEQTKCGCGKSMSGFCDGSHQE